MNRSTALRFGTASLLALPVGMFGPPLVVLIFHLHHYPDFFYLALAGVILSILLSLPAAAKISRWWILSPVVSVVALTLISLVLLK